MIIIWDLIVLTVGKEDTGKRSGESEAEMIVMMLPSDANPKGNVFGGPRTSTTIVKCMQRPHL